MPNTLRTLGTLAGVVGLLTCLFAGLARLTVMQPLSAASRIW